METPRGGDGAAEGDQHIEPVGIPVLLRRIKSGDTGARASEG